MLVLYTPTASLDYVIPENATSSAELSLEFRGSQEISVSIQIIDDDTAEIDEQFTVGLLVFDQLIDFVDITIVDSDTGKK